MKHETVTMVRLGTYITVTTVRLEVTAKYFGCTFCFWVVTNGGNFDARPPGTESWLRPCIVTASGLIQSCYHNIIIKGGDPGGGASTYTILCI